MSKFVIECPACGKFAEAKTGFFARKKIDCACGYTIDVRTDKLTARECPHCGNEVVFDQSKGEKAMCPVCHEPINTQSEKTKVAEFSCAQCGIRLRSNKATSTYICPVCDCVNDVPSFLFCFFFCFIPQYRIHVKMRMQNTCKGTYVKKKAEDTDGLAIDKTKYLSIADAQKLMELTSEYSNFNTMIQLLLHTGMRSGELLGLKWECINFEAKTICIKYTKCNTDHFYLSPPKTAKSRRTICIDDDMVQMLKRHKQEQDKLKKAFGDAWEQPEMVFTTGTGKWFDRNELNKRLKRLMKQNGLPEISAHKLRHTYASLLVYSGEQMQVISENLGHASCDITSRVYAHVYPEAKQRTAKTISNILNNKQAAG